MPDRIRRSARTLGIIAADFWHREGEGLIVMGGAVALTVSVHTLLALALWPLLPRMPWGARGVVGIIGAAVTFLAVGLLFAARNTVRGIRAAWRRAEKPSPSSSEQDQVNHG